MSHLPASKQEGRRTARKPVVASPRQQTKPVKRLTQRDMDSSCHRLSRVPQKFTANKAIQNEKQEPYAVQYFKNNPDARDSQPPDKKLEAYEEKLKGDLEISERFTTLMQQKALRYIVFGENSVEALESHAAIGKFYNENNRPASALRHLVKARQLEDTNEIEQQLSIEIAVETCESHLALRSDKKSETTKHVNQAGTVISRYAETEIADARMRYRRDIVKARVSAAKNEFETAITQYEAAWMSLDEANNGEAKEETAVLYHELANCYDATDKRKQAAENYKKAYDLYRDFGNDEAADAIEEKLPQPGEEFEEEEQEITNERVIEEEDEASEHHSETPEKKESDEEPAKEESEPAKEESEPKAQESEEEKLPDVLGGLMKQSEEEKPDAEDHEEENQNEKISEDNWEKEESTQEKETEGLDDTQGFENDEDEEKQNLSDTGGFEDESEDKKPANESEGMDEDFDEF